ncbi:HlyC/CorC family transporter [Ramlibacter ginsenosidimutans]|uniref:HlyC/CorC family transporter n=1 Tax=Ramlibacter ginsenosidimutans TaxID=502333 RepID=A0A934TWN0_9BURK|nr:hemolysin family protein [Ramlibacter ginsenosidimutans]MBK6008002.1 HlyC/CorC family transporter [Ramlibacter ginsenosidimutans]
MDFLLIALLTVLNGLFAMSEMALASSRRARLAVLAEDGDGGAQAALKLLDQPTQFLSTVQVGITSIGVINGIIGEAAFSEGVAAWLRGFGMPQRASAVTATAIVVAIITYITILLGELVPKRIGQIYPEQIARFMARPMRWLSRAAGPFVRVLSASTQAILKLLAIDTRKRNVTEEEIAHSLEEGVQAGVIEQHEHQMVRNVFHLDDRPLTSMMVPRTDVQWLEATMSVRDALKRAGEIEAHSWYPVCRGSLDDVVGLVSVSRLISLGPQHEGPIEPHALPALFVPETLTGMELLEQFRMQAARLVFVVDEYGVVQGLLTPHDLLEAITGELQPALEHEAWATQREDGSWLLDGLMPVSELKARLEIRELPEEDKGRYNTLAGLLMAVSGHLPEVGERIDCGEWVFEVVDLDGRRIDKVLAQPVPEPADAAAGD